jgi:hypothetical protein
LADEKGAITRDAMFPPALMIIARKRDKEHLSSGLLLRGTRTQGF